MAHLLRAQRAAAAAAQADPDQLNQALSNLSTSDHAFKPEESDNDTEDGGTQLTPSTPAEEEAALHTNIIQFFDTNYGCQENRLEGWQLLCKHLNVPGGPSVKSCKKELKKVYINIPDFVAAQQGGPAFKRFGSYTALCFYILRTRKYFPLRKAKESPILRWMLIKVS